MNYILYKKFFCLKFYFIIIMVIYVDYQKKRMEYVKSINKEIFYLELLIHKN